MDNYWQDRFAFSTSLFREVSLAEGLDTIAAAGFTKVEVWADRSHLDARVAPDTSALRAQLGRLGVQVHSVHLPWAELRLGHPEPALLATWLPLWRDTLELAAQLDAGLAVIHVTSDTKTLPGDLYDASRAIMQDAVGRLAEDARRLGLRLALENLPHLSPERRRFGASLDDLVAAFPDEEIGFCLDIGHAAVNQRDVAAEIHAAGQRLISIHAASNDGQADLHWLPSLGLPHWERVKAALKAEGYARPIVLEVLRLKGHEEGEMAGEVLRQSAQFAQTDMW